MCNSANFKIFWKSRSFFELKSELHWLIDRIEVDSSDAIKTESSDLSLLLILVSSCYGWQYYSCEVLKNSIENHQSFSSGTLPSIMSLNVRINETTEKIPDIVNDECDFKKKSQLSKNNSKKFVLLIWIEIKSDKFKRF